MIGDTYIVEMESIKIQWRDDMTDFIRVSKWYIQ